MTEKSDHYRFSEIADSFGSPMLLLSSAGKILDLNLPAARLFAATREDLLGRPLTSLSAEPKGVETSLRKWLRTSQPTPDTIVLKSGEQPLQCRCWGAVLGPRGDRAKRVILRCEPRDYQPTQFLLLNEKIESLHREIAEQRSLQEERTRLLQMEQSARKEAEAASRQKDEFLGMVSHELRTPITTIYGNARLLTMYGEELNDQERQGALSDIASESERLRSLIENMLMLARLGTDRIPQEEIVSLPEQLDLIAEQFRRYQPERKLVLSLDQSVPPLLAVPVYLEMIVSNLLSNAHKYSPPDTMVYLTLRLAGEGALVSVLDEGVGIKPGEEETIFEPFFRDAKVKDSIGGIGLGLAVCKRLIEAHGGSIYARARAEGGTEVSFLLPLQKKHAPAAKSPAPRPPA